MRGELAQVQFQHTAQSGMTAHCAEWHDSALIHELTNCVPSKKTRKDVSCCCMHASVVALCCHSRDVDRPRGSNLRATSEDIDSTASVARQNVLECRTSLV